MDLAPFPSGQFENLRRSADVSGACLVLSVSLQCSHKCAVQWSFSEIHLCALQCPRGMSSAHCIGYSESAAVVKVQCDVSVVHIIPVLV